MAEENRQNLLQRSLDRLGPGLITGASDDDPSGIATYTQAGAALGLATLWTAVLTLPLMIAVQHTCAKVGMCSGRGFASVLKTYYSKWLLYPAVLGLLVANTINVGADLTAIAAAINIFVPLPIWVLVLPIAVGIMVLEIWGSYKLIVRIFKWLTVTLFAYIVSAFLAGPNWSEVLRATVIPNFTFSSAYITTIVAILGTTISPYLFFWQASQEVEEEYCTGRTTLTQRKGATAAEMRKEVLDTVTGMIFCNVVFYFVILAAASTLHPAGKTEIKTAAEAAEALRPLAGNLATTLFAIGLIGSGLLAVPVLAGSAAYAVSETFDWRAHLNDKPSSSSRFYGVIAASTLIGVAIGIADVNPMSALFWTAVINGVVAPPLLVTVIFVANNKKVMQGRANGVWVNILVGLAAVLMFAAAIAMFVSWGQ
ncbi:MAG: Nramp family divalent metal transporter [Pyrinomonadaceae bacterium]